MSSSDECKLYDCSTSLLNVTAPSGFTVAQRRWRIAYIRIYSSRVMLSLADKIISQRATQLPSMTSQQFDHYVAEFDHKINQKRLVKTVKEKDLVSLNHLGGVDGVVDALCTNSEHGIRDDEQEVIKRFWHQRTWCRRRLVRRRKYLRCCLSRHSCLCT